VDQVALSDMPEFMRIVEEGTHDQRQNVAFERILENPSIRQKDFHDVNIILSAKAEETDEVKCDDECKRRISERRALFQQSRSTRSRQELFNLSRQRASLYNTTSQAANCVPGFPCW